MKINKLNNLPVESGGHLYLHKLAAYSGSYTDTFYGFILDDNPNAYTSTTLYNKYYTSLSDYHVPDVLFVPTQYVTGFNYKYIRDTFMKYSYSIGASVSSDMQRWTKVTITSLEDTVTQIL